MRHGREAGEKPMSEAKPIRVVLADDHAVVRKGIREFLEEDVTTRTEAVLFALREKWIVLE